MLIQVKTNIVAMEEDLIFLQNFHLQMEAWEKIVIIFGVDMSSSVYIDNKDKDIWIPWEGLTQGVYII